MWRGLERLEEVKGSVPLSGEERFPARVQRYNRVQIPVLVRWRHKLEQGEVLYVRVYKPKSYGDEEFYARVLEGGRITIPKLVVGLLEVEAGDVVYVTLFAERPAEEDEE